MYRVSHIKEISLNLEDNTLYDILLTVYKVNERDPDEIPVDADSHKQLIKLIYMFASITKGKKEIKDFLKHLLKLINEPIYLVQLKEKEKYENLKRILFTMISFKVQKYLKVPELDPEKKRNQDMKTLKDSLDKSINILNIIDSPALWTQSIITDFFEISMFNFYKYTNWQNILKQGWLIASQISKEKFDQNHESSPNQNQSTNNMADEFQLKEVMLIDSQWEMGSKQRLNKFYIIIKTNNRLLKIKFDQKDDFKVWKLKIQRAITTSPWNARLDRFATTSFAPTRLGNKIKIMIDGEHYFRNLAIEIQRAQSEIFITDWWMVPKLHLIRPVCLSKEQDNEATRLDLLLLAAAERGVKVYIVHWAGSKFAVVFNSLEIKRYLNRLHPNIKMIRHPRQAISLWSHHAKLVIIDQSLAFIGGLDLCYGRYDKRYHPLLDINDTPNQLQNFPGQDYLNERLRAPTDTENHKGESINRETEVRMPFHDLEFLIEGECAIDLAHHFIQYWNNSKLDKLGARNKSYLPTITSRERFGGMFNKVFKKNPNDSANQSGGTGMKSSVRDIKLKQVDEEQTQKFEEDLEMIVQKNINLNSFKHMHSKSPKKLTNINAQNINKVQTLFKAKWAFKKGRKPPPDEGQKIITKIDLDSQKALPRNNSELFIDTEKIISIPKMNENNKLPGREFQDFEKPIGTYNEMDFILNKAKTLEGNALSTKQEPGLMSILNANQAPMKFDYIKEENEYPKGYKDTNQANLIGLDDSAYLKTEEIQIIMHQPIVGVKNEHQSRMISHVASPLKESQILNQQTSKYFMDDYLDQIVYNNCSVQPIRSASAWSLGLLKVEHSIYEAYIQLIELAEKLIFIQNQFFVTSCSTIEENKKSVVKNKLGLALRERILRAHFSNQEFLVMVFLPLMPGFSGDVTDSIASILRIQMAYQFETISKGEFSLIELLKKDGIPDPFKYIKFYSLRNHDLMKNGVPIQEIIYIHAKLLIVDDRYVIIGSANINDRSLLGSRDHEIGVLVSQPNREDQVEVEMAGSKMWVSKLAHNLRTELMIEHWGFDYDQIKDPYANIDKLDLTAANNSRIYFDVFQCEPDDNIKNFKELLRIREEREKKKRKKEVYQNKYLENKDQIQGQIVNFPTQFLIEESLNNNFLNTELMVPEIVFT